MLMANVVLELKDVTKTYGSSRGIDNVSLKVEAGQVFGFLGPNGAGKSTTINLLIDLIRPTKGKINIFGLDSVKNGVQIRSKIGFLIGDMSLDSSLSGWQQLEYFGNLRGNFSPKRVKELASLLDINLNRKIKDLSRGNRQKVGLISALMHEPELLILDEPTSGLDPLIQDRFNKIILDLKAQGKTTFMSSHMLSEVQEMCDQVAFVREGKIIDVKLLNTMAAGLAKKVNIVTDNKANLVTELKKLTGTKLNQSTKNSVSLTFSGDVNELLRLLAKQGVNDVTISEADLETVFMNYYKDKADV
jgi:ABC-2 type transport system ATP-binding protein